MIKFNDKIIEVIFKEASEQGDIRYIFDYEGKTYFIQ